MCLCMSRSSSGLLNISGSLFLHDREENDATRLHPAT